MTHRTLPLLALALAAALARPAAAAEFHVTTAQELQTALSTAQANAADDVIHMAAGTYGGRFTFISDESFALTIKAEDGLNPGQVVLDGESLGRVLYVYDNGTGDFPVTMQSLVIQNGSGVTYGAGAYLETGGNIQVTSCIVRANSNSNTSGSNAGGIYIHTSGTVLLESNGVLDNATEYDGGGIFIHGATTATITGNRIQRNTTSGAHDADGGGVFLNDVRDARLHGNQFDNNQGTFGGGICIRAGGGIMATAEFTDNTFSNNQSFKSYGAIGFMWGATLTTSVILTGNIINDNSAGQHYAGAFIYSAPTVTIRDNQFSGNQTASGYTNGGLSVYEVTDLIVEDNIFSENQADAYGAGALAQTGTRNSITFTGNTITGNTARNGHYGGFSIGPASTTLISNNLISGNTSTNGSTALGISNGGTLDIVNNTVTGNTATANPSYGGITSNADPGETLNFYNNIAWGNTGVTAGDINVSGSGTRNAYNNNYHDLEGLWSFEGNNIDVAPLFVDEAAGDYHLGTGSLCLDAGDNAAPSLPATDAEGNARIADGTVDLGAYEHSTSDLHPADADQNWTLTAAEATAYGDAWRTAVGWASGPSPIPMNYATRAGYLSTQSGGTYNNAGGGKPLCWVPGP